MPLLFQSRHWLLKIPAMLQKALVKTIRCAVGVYFVSDSTVLFVSYLGVKNYTPLFSLVPMLFDLLLVAKF